MNEAFDIGVQAELEKIALLGRIGTSLLRARGSVAGAGARVARRFGGGTGRLAQKADLLSTKLTKKQRAFQSAAKTRSASAASAASAKQQFKQQAAGMAPSKRVKAREALQKRLAAEKSTQKGALTAARQKQGLIPKAAPAPVKTPGAQTAQGKAALNKVRSVAPSATPAAKPAAGGSAGLLQRLRRPAAYVGAGAALGAGAAYAAQQRAAPQA